MSREEISLAELSPTHLLGGDSLRIHLVAGVLSGVVGLLVFLVIHHFWITPIWFILPVGLLIAAGGGLAVGWAYHELSPRLPAHPWSVLALIALIGIILVPSILLAELRQPLFTINETSSQLSVSLSYAVAIFIFELLLTTTLAGGLVGWIIGRTTRAALATGVAGLIFALGPGHNIPFLGNTPGTGKGIAILSIILLSAAVVLVEGPAIMRGWATSKNE